MRQDGKQKREGRTYKGKGGSTKLSENLGMANEKKSNAKGLLQRSLKRRKRRTKGGTQPEKRENGGGKRQVMMRSEEGKRPGTWPSRKTCAGGGGGGQDEKGVGRGGGDLKGPEDRLRGTKTMLPPSVAGTTTARAH